MKLLVLLISIFTVASGHFPNHGDAYSNNPYNNRPYGNPYNYNNGPYNDPYNYNNNDPYNSNPYDNQNIRNDAHFPQAHLPRHRHEETQSFWERLKNGFKRPTHRKRTGLGRLTGLGRDDFFENTDW